MQQYQLWDSVFAASLTVVEVAISFLAVQLSVHVASRGRYLLHFAHAFVSITIIAIGTYQLFVGGWGLGGFRQKMWLGLVFGTTAVGIYVQMVIRDHAHDRIRNTDSS